MSRDAESRAKATYAAQDAASKLYGANAAAAYSQLMPQFTTMALNPQGLSPTDRANLKTSSMQSAGGSTAGAITQGNLAAARTGNAGGYQATLSDAVRRGTQQNSDNALKVDLVNSDLREKQRNEGLAGLNGLYGDNLRASTGELNAENQSTRALTEAAKSGWFQDMLGLATTAATVKRAFGPSDE